MSAVPKYKSEMILRLWQKCFDTSEIATRLSLTGAYVYNTISRWRK